MPGEWDEPPNVRLELSSTQFLSENPARARPCPPPLFQGSIDTEEVRYHPWNRELHGVELT